MYDNTAGLERNNALRTVEKAERINFDISEKKKASSNRLEHSLSLDSELRKVIISPQMKFQEMEAGKAEQIRLA